MYRCGICGSCSQPRQPRHLHVIYRDKPNVVVAGGKEVTSTRKEIAREIPVCPDCKLDLNSGVSVESLISYYSPELTPPVAMKPAPQLVNHIAPSSGVMLGSPVKRS